MSNCVRMLMGMASMPLDIPTATWTGCISSLILSRELSKTDFHARESADEMHIGRTLNSSAGASLCVGADGGVICMLDDGVVVYEDVDEGEDVWGWVTCLSNTTHLAIWDNL